MNKRHTVSPYIKLHSVSPNMVIKISRRSAKILLRSRHLNFEFHHIEPCSTICQWSQWKGETTIWCDPGVAYQFSVRFRLPGNPLCVPPFYFVNSRAIEIIELFSIVESRHRGIQTRQGQPCRSKLQPVLVSWLVVT